MKRLGNKILMNNKERSIFLIDFLLWLRTAKPKTMSEICHNYCNYSSHIYLFIWCLLFSQKYKKKQEMKTKTRPKIHLYRYNIAIDRLSACLCYVGIIFGAFTCWVFVIFSILCAFQFRADIHFDSHFILRTFNSFLLLFSLSLINEQQNMFYYLFCCNTCCHNFC